MRLILLGAPGAGKGTQADVVKSKYRIAHISTGDILRANVKQGTDLGKLAQGYMTSGKLVPDDVIINMMKARLVEPDCNEGFMLDGFPRTITQAQALDKMLSELGISLDAVVSLEIDDEVVVSRLTSRRVCKQCGEIYNTIGKPSRVEGVCDKCGGEVIQRADDNESTIRNRLSVFHEQTAPLIEYYKKAGILVSVDATAGKNSVLKIVERKD